MANIAAQIALLCQLHPVGTGTDSNYGTMIKPAVWSVAVAQWKCQKELAGCLLKKPFKGTDTKKLLECIRSRENPFPDWWGKKK